MRRDCLVIGSCFLAALEPHPATASSPDAGAFATFAHVGTWLGKPPLARLDLDVFLRNPGPRPRFIFIPGTVGGSEGGVRDVTIYELPGRTPPWLWHLEGMGGGFAVLLPPHGEATLRALGIESWLDPLPGSVAIGTVLCDDILIGGEPIARFVGIEDVPTIAGEHDARIDPMKSRVVRSRGNPRDASGLTPESPLSFADAIRVEAPVTLYYDPRGAPTPPAVTSIAWPASFEPLIEKTITLEGKALEAKTGPLLAGSRPSEEIGIDADSWPAGFYQGLDRGRRVRVTGRVIRRGDLPVFHEGEGEPRKTGIPLPEGTPLEEAAMRYLLSDVTWTPLD